MMPECLSITYKKEVVVEVRDADGVAIHPGSVVKRTDEDGRDVSGVVTKILMPGDMGTPMSCVGDMHVHIKAGITRVSNEYGKWRHVPHNEQTYAQRLLSWKYRKYEHEEDRDISYEEGLAIDGIMALLPDDIVDWEWGPWPDRLEDALGFLVAHLEGLKEDKADEAADGD
jgi:hypothetical protein